MAGSVNKVLVVGRLGQDPNVHYTAEGTPVANLSVATDESYKNKNGDKVEKTEWHRVSCFGNTAKFCADYLTKGRLVSVEGSLQTRKWKDKEDRDRFTTEIKAMRVQALDPKNAESSAKPKTDERPAPPPPSEGFDEDAPF